MGTKQSKLDSDDVTPPSAQTNPSLGQSQPRTEIPQGDGTITNVQCLQHTSVPMSDAAPEPPTDPNPDEDMSMFPAPHPEHITLHVFTPPSTEESEKNAAMITAAALDGDEEVFVDFCVKLMPHQHTLFCERRERVCAAVGKVQEGEELEVDGLLDTTGGYWIRSLPHDKHSTYSFIQGTENSPRYTLTAEDDGRFIAFQYAQLLPKEAQKGDKRSSHRVPSTGIDVCSDTDTPHFTTASGELFETKRTMNSLGPVLPGPPRMLDLRVEGKDGFQAGRGVRVRAEGQYIGGREGLSEYWWFKIMNGKRIQLSEPLAKQEGEEGGGSDPREYELKEEDVGCVLKVKCRPVRSDGHKGEIFTSKASAVII